MRKFTATGILLFLLSGWAGAQELMTLEQAVSIGLTNNYGIIISQNSFKEAKNNATAGNAGMLPAIGVNAGLVKGLYDAKVKVITGNELDNPAAKSDLITAGAGLTWRVFDGLKMFITLDKLKKVEEISDLSAKITIENTIARIIGAYYEIVKQGRVLDALKEQVEISKLRLDLAKVRFDTGKGSEMEYLKGRIELNADVASLSNQKALYENAKTTLNDLLSREISLSFNVVDTIPVTKALNYDSLLNSVKLSNKNLLLSIRNREAGALDVKSARANQSALRLEAIGAAADERGQRIGSALLSKLEDEARRLAIAEIRTTASWRDHTIMQFLNRAGFELGGDLAIECLLGEQRLETADADQVLAPAHLTGFSSTETDYSQTRENDFEALARDKVDLRTLKAEDLYDIVRIDKMITGHRREAYIYELVDEAMVDSAVRVSLVARVDGLAVGFVMARADFGDYGRAEPVAVLDTIGVNPEYARQGVGHALLSQLFVNLDGLRVERVETVVARHDFQLLGFFYDLGFKPSQRLGFVKRVA